MKNLYNGNISETFWRTNKDNVLRSYGYTYDDLNRLRNAQYIRPVNPLLPNTNLNPIVNTFNESMQYDKNGNIVALQRNGGMESQSQFPLIDDLVYQYNGNQLTKVTDNTNNSVDGFKDGANLAVEYTYDLNGNMTTDQNKGITTITYNHLNLPTKIIITGGTITYNYNALGQKVSKTVSNNNPTTTSNTEYLGGFQYNNGVLQYIPTAEGYVKNTVVNGANTYDYIFNYTDHLGNIRLSYGIAPVTQQLTIFEENNYYPFGMKHATYNYQLKTIENLKDVPSLNTTSDSKAAVPINPDPIGNLQIIKNSGYQYKFSGKELQDELGLGIYDYGARMYDPAGGPQFWQVDPLAEEFPSWSPYTMCYDNPIKYKDPDGRAPTDWWKNNKTGKYVWYNQPTDGGVLIVAGHSYVGENINDVNNDFSNSNNFFVRNFSSPKFGDYGDKWQGEVQSDPETTLDRYANSDNLLKKGAYDLVDQPFVTFQSLNPFDQNLQHLNGDGVSPKEKLESGVQTISSLLPAPKSEFTLMKSLNAPAFSKLFKGTFVAGLKPSARGFLNRNLNTVIKKATNEAVILNTSVKAAETVNEEVKKEP